MRVQVAIVGAEFLRPRLLGGLALALLFAVLLRESLPALRKFGAGFLVVKYFEYSAKFHHGYYPKTNTFLAIYFTMTGLHGLHPNAARTLLYVGITRARSHLIAVEREEVLGEVGWAMPT